MAPGWAKRVPPSAIGSPARMRSRVDLPAPLRPTSDSRSPGAIDEIDAVQHGLVAEVEADAGERQEGWIGHGYSDWERRVWPKLSTWARITMRLWFAHAAGRGGPEADRSRHQAPARRPEGRSCARRAADLARRRAAHHHPLGARRCLLVGLRAARRSRDALLLGHAPDAPTQAREHHLRDQPAARRRRPEGRRHHRRRRCRRALSRPFRPHGRHAARPAQVGLPRVSSRRRVATRSHGPTARRPRR